MNLAVVTFFGAEKGGRITPPKTGFHPQIGINDAYTSCIVDGIGEDVFDFDISYRVKITLMFPDLYPDAFKGGDKINFYEGNRLIGSGYLLEDGQE